MTQRDAPPVFINFVQSCMLHQTEEDEMGGACGPHGKCKQNFGRKNLKRRDHSEELGVDGKLIFECILGK